MGAGHRRGRASGDTTARARAVLAGIDDGDPAVLDALPTCDLPGQWADAPAWAELYADAAPSDAPPWTTLEPAQQEDAIGAYREEFDTTVAEGVVRHCRTALAEPPDPGGAWPDPAHPPRGRVSW